MSSDQRRRLTLLRQARSEAKLVPIGWALAGMLALALVIAAAVAGFLLLLVPYRPFKPEALSTTALYDLLKIAFAFAAGVGGVVALVTAYRRQRVAEFAQDLAARTEERTRDAEQHQREISNRADARDLARLFNDRFATAAGQLGNDAPAVRLAGIYAMAGLADDWAEQRQTGVDVLCAYLRMPYQPKPAGSAPTTEHQMFGALREVRHTVIRVIAAHLQPENRRADSLRDWRGLNFDFSGAIFDGGSFSHAEFSGGAVNFRFAEFSDGVVEFRYAEFSGGLVDFGHAEFSGGVVDFGHATFSGGVVDFDHAGFSGGKVEFRMAGFSGGVVDFRRARFSGGVVDLSFTEFSGGKVDFSHAGFSGGAVDFRFAKFSGGKVDFSHAGFSGGKLDFSHAGFSGGTVDFGDAGFYDGTVNFHNAGLSVRPLGLDHVDGAAGILLHLPGE